MALLLGIPYVNRPDLLRRALASVEALWPSAVLVDNSEQGDLIQDPGSWPVRIQRIRGVAPLSFSQSMNLLQAIAVERNCPAWFFLHSDAQASNAVVDRLMQEVQQALNRTTPWGAIFTFYDTFCAFSTAALAHVGRWDVNLPQYFSDNDYYYRLRLAGYDIIDLKLPVLHQEGGSCTLHSDPRRLLLNKITFPLYERYYEAKWGGPSGREVFAVPFNSDLFGPRVELEVAPPICAIPTCSPPPQSSRPGTGLGL
jgi:hypothetical protein